MWSQEVPNNFNPKEINAKFLAEWRAAKQEVKPIPIKTHAGFTAFLYATSCVILLW